jgi:NAD-dependent SIR2 family protein deacetylase
LEKGRALAMAKFAYCIMCRKKIGANEGHYVLPYGPVCMDCHDKYIKPHIYLPLPF